MTPRKKGRRKYGRLLLRLAIILIVLPIAVVLVAVKTEWGQSKVRAALVDVIHDELGLEAELGVFDVDILTGQILARDITLDNPTWGRFAEAEALVVSPSFGSLLRGTVDLQSIQLERPSIRLLIRDGKILNLPTVEGGDSDEPINIPIRELVARRARVSVDMEPHLTAELEDVHLGLRVRDGHMVSLMVQAPRGRVQHANGVEEVESLLIRGDASLPDAIHLEVAELRTDRVRVALLDTELPLPFVPTPSADDIPWTAQFEAEVMSLEDLERLPLDIELPPFEGHVMVAGTLTGGEGIPTGQVTVDIEQGRIESKWGFGDLVHLEVDLNEERAQLLEGSYVQLTESQGQIALVGTIGLQDAFDVDVRAGIQGLEFNKLMIQLGVTRNAIVQWTFTGDLRLQGTLNPLDLGGPMRVNTTNLHITQGPWHRRPYDSVLQLPRAQMNGRMTIKEDAVRFEDIVAQAPHSRVWGDVMLGYDNQVLVTAGSDNIDLRDVDPLVGFQMGGTGPVSVRVDGEFSDPQVTGHMRLRDFTFDTFPVGTIESDFALEKGGLAVRFPRVVAVKEKSRFWAEDFVLDFSEHFETTTVLHAERMELRDFYHVFHFEHDERFESYQGVVRGRVPIRYTRGFPGDGPNGTMVADIDVSVPQAELSGFAFTDGTFQGRFTWLDYERGYEGGVLDVQRAILHKDGGTVYASGRMEEGGVLRVFASADRIPLSSTEGVGDRFPDLNGVYGLTAHVSGTASIPRADVDVALTGLSWGTTALGDMRTYVKLTDKRDPWIAAARGWDLESPPEGEPCGHARAGFANGRWRPDPPVRTRDGPRPALERPMAWIVCGEGLGGEVELDLAVGRTQVYPVRGLLRLADMDLSRYLPYDVRRSGASGVINAEALISGGALKVDDSLVAEVSIDRFELGVEGVTARNRGPIEIDLDRGDFQVERGVIEGAGSALQVTGGGSLRNGLATRLSGDLDLALLGSLSPQVSEASGLVSVEVDIGGPLLAPTVDGRAQVRGGAFRFASFEQPLTNLNGTVAFNTYEIALQGFEADVGSGHVALGGRASLAGLGLERFEVDVNAEDISYSPQEGLDLGLGAEMHLEWTDGERLPLLTGTLAIDHFQYTRPIELNLIPTLDELSREERATVDQYDPDADLVALDIRVTQEAPFRIRNNVMDAEVRIEDRESPFRIVGTDQRYGVLGKLDVTRGRMRFRTSEFEVRDGRIEFNDRNRIAPRFDLTASTEVRRNSDIGSPSWRVYLHALGDQNEMTLNTRSEPALSQEDILFLLFVGMTRSEFDQLQAGGTNALALEALASVTGVDREVRQAIPEIDDFGLTTAYSQTTGRTEPHVTVGKRISERVRLSARTAISEASDFRTWLEWRLNDETSLQFIYDNVNTTSANPFGNFGADLRWRVEFE